jgi:hypothetical protein
LIVFIAENSYTDSFKNNLALAYILRYGGGSLVAEHKAVALGAGVRFSPIALDFKKSGYRHLCF